MVHADTTLSAPTHHAAQAEEAAARQMETDYLVWNGDGEPALQGSKLDRAALVPPATPLGATLDVLVHGAYVRAESTLMHAFRMDSNLARP